MCDVIFFILFYITDARKLMSQQLKFSKRKIILPFISTATLWQDPRNLTPSKGSKGAKFLHRLLCRYSWWSDMSGCLKAK